MFEGSECIINYHFIISLIGLIVLIESGIIALTVCNKAVREKLKVKKQRQAADN